MPNEPKWGDSLSSISKAIYVQRVNDISDKIRVGIVILITDNGITTFDYELHYVTIMEGVPSLVRKMQEEHHIDKVWVAKDTRKLYMKYLKKEKENA